MDITTHNGFRMFGTIFCWIGLSLVAIWALEGTFTGSVPIAFIVLLVLLAFGGAVICTELMWNMYIKAWSESIEQIKKSSDKKK